ncbi:MAG: diguanylate cyclase [Sideroxydans sp.]|nr:diguanylate cyclase [Sideroxydans sp.]
MQRIVKALDDWLNWGVESQPNYTLKRKVLLTNMIAFAALAGWAFFISIFLVLGESYLYPFIYVGIPLYLMMAAVPWMNRKGMPNLARFAGLFAAIVSVLIPIWMFFGRTFSSHYYFLLLAAAPIVLFTLRQWLLSSSIFLVCVGLFFLVQMGFFEAHPKINELGSSTIDWISNTFIFMAALNFLIFAWFIDKTAAHNERELSKLAITDPLTGMPNRRFFDLAFFQAIAKGKRLERQLVLAVIDIDHFKEVNDVHGHEAGDEVLRQLATLLTASTRAGNIVARIGGEEFAVLFADASMSDAHEVAERIRGAIESTLFNYAGTPLKITISIGLSQAKWDVEQTFKAADSALYLAKQNGRNRVVFELESAFPEFRS